MRYIDISQLTPSGEWIRRAEDAKQEVETAPPEQRAEVIKRHADIWRQLKDDLARLSFDKCWYCETKINRSDANVDHFRPKANVETCDFDSDGKLQIRDTSHEGYWWLAFDWRNYRYSCQYCNMRRRDPETGNTGGKGALFPLLDENSRVYDYRGNISQERVALLDPTDPRDPVLLWFDQTGETVPAPQISEEDKKRVHISVAVYHLNYSRTKQARQILFNEIKLLVEKLNDAIFEKNLELIREILSSLRRYIAPEAQYSVAARHFLQGLRSAENAEIIDRLLSTV